MRSVKLAAAFAGALALGLAAGSANAAAPGLAGVLDAAKSVVAEAGQLEQVHYRRSGKRFFFFKRHRPLFFFHSRPRLVFFVRRHY